MVLCLTLSTLLLEQLVKITQYDRKPKPCKDTVVVDTKWMRNAKGRIMEMGHKMAAQISSHFLSEILGCRNSPYISTALI